MKRSGPRNLFCDGNRNAVYNVEQAVEMIVLALAQAEGVHFQRSQQHQLDTMVRGLPPENAFVADLSGLTWLEAHATTFRYPRTMGGISDPPSAERLQGAIAMASGLLQGIAGHFGVTDLSTSAKTPSLHAKPPRKA